MNKPIQLADIDGNQFAGMDIAITGGTSGIGKKATLALGDAGASVYFNGRSGGEEIESKINEEMAGNAHFIKGDLSQINEIRALSKKIKQETDKLDMLVNNAGVYYRGNKRSMSLEYTYVVNNVSHFYITLDLLSHLRKSNGESRIINTASEAHRTINSIKFSDLESSQNDWKSYSRSKTFNIMFTDCLRRRLSEDITCTSIHPGVIPSSGFIRNLPIPLQKSSKIFEYIPIPFINSTEEGAAMIIYGATRRSDKLSLYYSDFESETPSDLALDNETQEKFWNYTADKLDIETKPYFEESIEE